MQLMIRFILLISFVLNIQFQVHNFYRKKKISLEYKVQLNICTGNYMSEIISQLYYIEKIMDKLRLLSEIMNLPAQPACEFSKLVTCSQSSM